MYLIDSNVLLFSFDHTEKLTPKVKQILETEENLYVSMASIWEIEIKRNLGKLKIPYGPKELVDYCISQDYLMLDIKVSHIAELEKLPKIHNDPFYRLIICQSIAENMPILTSDLTIQKYPGKTIW